MRSLARVVVAALLVSGLGVAGDSAPAGARLASGPPTGVATAAGFLNSLVVAHDGLVYGTGSNYSWQLTGTGIGDRRALTLVRGLPAGVHAIAAAAGYLHSLVVADDGLVYGAGNNGDAQLTGRGGDQATLTPLTGLPAGVWATAAAASGSFSLVVADDGLVYGTGSNYHGQLTGRRHRQRTLTPLTGLPAGVRALATAGGWGHSLVVADDGLVYGTGYNGDGQLTGVGDKDTLAPLTGLPAGVRAVAVAAGFDHSVVVADDGRVYGTGDNDSGQLTGAGDNDTLTRLVWGITNTVRPRITGTPRLGKTLTTRHGTWWPVPTSYTYRWYRNGTAIKGARGSTHQVMAPDIGTRPQVEVTAKHPGYQPTSRQTKRTEVITRR